MISASLSAASLFAPPTDTAQLARPAAREASSARLSQAELAQVSKLRQTDSAVRRHEQAHLAAAGGLAVSGANFTYQRGPDGANYAVGGEVKIQVSPGRTPEETLRRAQLIRAAALAPADPSNADLAAAAAAAQLEQQARAELAQQARDAQDSPASNVASFYARGEQPRPKATFSVFA
jgi:hypothetical protein